MFETDPTENRRLKGKKILSELQQKTAIYQSMRGMRAPTIMEKHVGQREPRVADSNSTNLNKGPDYNAQPKTEKTEITTLYRGALKGVPGDSIGRVPLIPTPEVQYAGVSNGESLWALPSSQSPEASSDTMSLSGGQTVPAPPISGASMDDPMADIDWARIPISFHSKTSLT